MTRHSLTVVRVYLCQEHMNRLEIKNHYYTDANLWCQEKDCSKMAVGYIMRRLFCSSKGVEQVG